MPDYSTKGMGKNFADRLKMTRRQQWEQRKALKQFGLQKQYGRVLSKKEFGSALGSFQQSGQWKRAQLRQFKKFQKPGGMGRFFASGKPAASPKPAMRSTPAKPFSKKPLPPPAGLKKKSSGFF